MEEIRIGPDDAGQRLDRFLRKYLRGAALPTIYKMIRTRQVALNGKKGRPEKRLEPGDVVTLYPADRRMGDLRGKERERRNVSAPALDVLYEDDDVLAVAKPPFLLVHEGRDAGEATLMDSVEAYLPPAGARTFRPNLAHRIDRLTSGVVLVGKSAEGLRGLTRQLRKRKLEKVYLALVRGDVEAEAGEIAAPIARGAVIDSDRLRVTVEEGGKASRPLFRVLARHAGLTLLEARPKTGRTHQIRAHLAHVGHPVLGDPTYGDGALNDQMKGRHGLWRQWLHAFSVRFQHPVRGQTVEVSAPLPEDLIRVLDGEGFARSSLPPGAAPGEKPARP